MNTNFNLSGTGIFGIIVGACGIGYGLYREYKANKKMEALSEKIGASMDKIEKNVPVEIEQDIIDKAIQNAVDRKVSAAAKDAVDAVRGDIRNEISKQVRKNVDACYETMQDEVSDKISEQVANIDQYALQDRVTKKAEDKILKRFDGILNGLAGKFDGDLTRLIKIAGLFDKSESSNGGSVIRIGN